MADNSIGSVIKIDNIEYNVIAAQVEKSLSVKVENDDSTTDVVDFNGSVAQTINIKGGGATQVTADADGTITISTAEITAGTHYTPEASEQEQLSADALGETAANWGATSLVTGVNLQRDAKGHVTGITVDSTKMPSNPNTWTANSKTAAGYVKAGNGYANRVWKTDADGNPDWREDGGGEGSVDITGVISHGTSDPDENITSQYYFKY